MLKNDIISLLRQNPNGLMAKHIAFELKKDVSRISKVLHSDTETFSVNNYVWTLVSKENTHNAAAAGVKPEIRDNHNI